MEITGLVHGTQMTIAETIIAMEDGVKEVDLGLENARKAGDALNSILSATDTVDKLVHETASATRFVRNETKELVRAIESVSEMVDRNHIATENLNTHSISVNEAIVTIGHISEENNVAIGEVSTGIEEVNNQVKEVNVATQALSQMASNLSLVTEQFRV